MTNGVKQEVNSQAQNSPSEQNIPKQRFDEVVAERNRLREEQRVQNEAMRTLTELVKGHRAQAQPQRAPQQDPRITKLLEQGREEEAQILSQIIEENRQMRNAMASKFDHDDRRDFLQAYGSKGGKDMMDRVEQLIEQERRNGNFRVTREGAFKWLKGEEALLKDERQESRQIEEQTVQQTAQVIAEKVTASQGSDQEDDVPSQDPSQVTSAYGGDLSTYTDDKSLEQRRRELENIEF